MTKQLQCEMSDECGRVVTHLEDKGYIYCAEHTKGRRVHGHRIRKLRPHELRRLERGEQITKY